MNRLTIRNSDGAWDVPLRNDDGAYIPSQEIIDRLARYEDTGLEPEQCAEYAQAEKEGRHIVLKEPRSAGVHRLEEIARADIEGRLVVLPCKVGDMVYFRRGRDILGDTVERIILEGIDDDGIDNQVLVGAHKAFMFQDFGKTVFLTREDAEKALEGMNNDER